MPEYAGYVFAIITTLAWGLVVIPVKLAKTPGELGVAVSMPSGLLALVPVSIVWFVRSADPSLDALFSPAGGFVAASGICQFPLATLFYYKAIQSSEISLVAPLKCVKSLMVIAIVIALGVEEITTRIVAAGLIGVAGSVVIGLGKRKAGPGSDGREPGAPSTVVASGLKKSIVYVLLACLFWSVGDILMQRGVARIPAMIATPVSLAVGMAVYYCWLIFTGRLGAVRRIPRRDKLCYFFHGLISFAIGYLTFFASIGSIGVTRAVIITSAWPLISFVVGIALYREALTPGKIAGVVLLVASVYLVILK